MALVIAYTKCMYYLEVAPTKIVRADQATFTYSSETPLAIGSLVRISIGRSVTNGVVISSTSKPTYDVKPINELLSTTPLPEPLVKAALWLSNYYSSPLASVLQSVLPRGIEKNRRPKSTPHKMFKRDRTNFLFTPQQQIVIEQVLSAEPGSLLLHGVTGSGKTEVYKALASQQLAAGRSVIILTPEIGLTPQLISDFAATFSDILVTHSHMTEAQRHLVWQQALESTEPRLVIGPRSAIFTPLKTVGLIVVDEAHEPSYKQEQTPRYSTLRLASMLARYHQATALFGSATPLVADYYLATQSDQPILSMTERASRDVKPPKIELIDNKDRTHFKKHRFLSDSLLASIDQNISAHTQTLIFHNRRGSAQTTLCENCGWTAQCPRCFVPLTLHGDSFDLRCHICDHHQSVPSSCPVCHRAEIIHKGIGTKIIESELKKLFPKAHIARFDSDNSEAESINERYDDLYNGTIDIAIGTQSVAKGLDLPKLRTVGVVQADSGLVLPDYTADERVFQLLAQVVGRVGRNQHDTNVFVQTYQPTHPAIQYGITQNYQGFYLEELSRRKHGLFPPYVYLLKLVCVYKNEASAIRSARQLAAVIKASDLPVQILGPTPAFRERVGGTFRWQLIIKSKKRAHLLTVLTMVPAQHWQFELDPSSLL